VALETSPLDLANMNDGTNDTSGERLNVGIILPGYCGQIASETTVEYQG
jgi:hypothetical protein